VFSLVLHALRARRVQAITLFALAALAALGASAAVWFAAWSYDTVARSLSASAPVTDRMVQATGTARYNPAAGDPLATLRATAEQAIPVEGAELFVAARVHAIVRPLNDDGQPADATVNLYVLARTDICEHLTFVEGACPQRGEAALFREVAAALGVRVGDHVDVRGDQNLAAKLRVSGIYVLTNPLENYWAGTSYLRELGAVDLEANPVVVSEQTLPDLQPDSLQVDVHQLLPADVFVDPAADLRGILRRGEVELRSAGVTTSVAAYGLLSRIDRDRFFVALGLTAGAAQLVLVSWVALFLAVRHTAEERRADIAMLKLRGTPARRLGTLVGLSSGLPMLGGTVLGAAAGFVAAAAFAYRSDPDLGVLAVIRTGAIPAHQALALSLAAAAVTGLGGLVVALAAESRMLRAPVVDLLRRVPGGHRGWRTGVADLVVVAVAAAGVYQAWVDARASARASVLALLAPALVALAVALLVARALPLAAAAVGTAALRAGRAGAALAALQLARRPGTPRVFAVLTVAAAVFAATTVLWRSAETAWHERAVRELGADRVLVVDAPSAAALLTAVRSVDPSGQYAMALAAARGVRTPERVLAIDTTRYAAIGRLPSSFPTPADLAAVLRPAGVAATRVEDGPVTLDVTVSEPAMEAVHLHLSTVTGQPQVVEFATPGSGRRSVQAEVTGCDPSCRLVAFEFVPAALTAPLTVEVHELRQPSGLVLDGPALADIARWRTTLEEQVVPPLLAARGDRLAVTLPGRPPRGSDLVPDHRVLPLTAPVPVPVAVAGPLRPRDARAGVAPLGGNAVPFVVAAQLPALPLLGDRGVLVDLEYALNNNDAWVESVELLVWLTADAPDSVVAGLADHGVTVLAERSVAQRTSQFAGQAPGLALGFEYFVAVVVLLLAAGVAVIGSTVDRSSRVAELSALRGQGVANRLLWTAGVAGTAVMIGAAVVVGVAAALVARALIATGLPAFSDGRILTPPSGLTAAALLGAVRVIVVVLGVAGVAAASRLVTAAIGRPGGRRARHRSDRRRARPGSGGSAGGFAARGRADGPDSASTEGAGAEGAGADGAGTDGAGTDGAGTDGAGPVSTGTNRGAGAS